MWRIVNVMALALSGLALTGRAADLIMVRQMIPDPSQIAPADNAGEQASGLHIDWRNLPPPRK